MAAVTLGGLLHCGYFEVDDEMTVSMGFYISNTKENTGLMSPDLVMFQMSTTLCDNIVKSHIRLASMAL